MGLAVVHRPSLLSRVPSPRDWTRPILRVSTTMDGMVQQPDPARRFNGGDGPSTETRAELLKTAYEEGRRAVDDQLAELDSMRQRSVQYMAFVASATAFLVGSGLGADRDRGIGFHGLAGLATGLGVLALILLSFILMAIVFTTDSRLFITHARWNFRLRPKVLVTGWIAPEVGAASEAEFYEDLALHYEDKLEENERWLKQIRRWYWGFILSGAAQVILWVWFMWRFA